MKKVLLAIDGINPDRNVFSYAVELCKRIKAELNVFQIIRPGNYSKYIKKIRQQADLARTYIEGSMVAATFAEAGEHETAIDIMAEASENINRLLPESEKAGVQCHFSIKSGNTEKEIIDYVNYHRDVVMAIYDFAAQSASIAGIKKKNTVPAKIKQKLSVPLVVVNAS